MRTLSLRVALSAVALLLASCASSPSSVPPASDEQLSRDIIGSWIRDETYPYGRFIGKLHLSSDGSGQREFGVYQRQPDGTSLLVPLLDEEFRWHVSGSVIVFTDRRVENVDPESPDRFTVENIKESHRETITELTEHGLRTRDDHMKTDDYERI